MPDLVLCKLSTLYASHAWCARCIVVFVVEISLAIISSIHEIVKASLCESKSREELRDPNVRAKNKEKRQNVFNVALPNCLVEAGVR